MAKRKNVKDEAKSQPLADNVHIKGAGSIQNEVITNTLTDNFMPYAMSIILSRAIPQIDGFKPSHRKLLYTMYNMGLLQGGTIKSANIVGRTMQLNPHGDAAIYETMAAMVDFPSFSAVLVTIRTCLSRRSKVMQIRADSI